MKHLVLASRSPRRRELIALLGLPFEARTSKVEESSRPGESPEEHVRRLSLEKARDVASTLYGAYVIGSDTVVVLDGDIIEKPEGPDEAVEMLLRIAGRTHTVFTGFALVDADDGRETAGVSMTDVTVRDFDRTTAERYVATGEPLDKAGAYGIQGFGSVLVTGIHGCYFTVMGLPLAELSRALESFSGGAFRMFGETAQENGAR